MKAIGLDLWETLITNTPEVARVQQTHRVNAMERVLIERRMAHDQERLHRAYRESWDLCQERYWSADLDIPCRRQIEHFLELLAIEVDDATIAELEDVYANAILAELPIVVDGAYDVLRELRERGMRVGLISNTGRTPGSALREVLARLDIAPSIDVMLFSNEHGECKPRPSIFKLLHESLGVTPEEMVFVGDNLYVDVYGAQQSGMKGIHFIPPQRGTAIAPPVDHGLTIVADATIRDLRELPTAIASLR